MSKLMLTDCGCGGGRRWISYWYFVVWVLVASIAGALFCNLWS